MGEPDTLAIVPTTTEPSSSPTTTSDAPQAQITRRAPLNREDVDKLFDDSAPTEMDSDSEFLKTLLEDEDTQGTDAIVPFEGVANASEDEQEAILDSFRIVVCMCETCKNERLNR